MIRLPTAFVKIPLAHRGLHDVADGRPENSRASIRAAMAAGYGIEIDLQLSADGQAMVFHDYQLNRLTRETGAVRLRTAAELADIELIGAAEGIPTLEQVLALVDGQVPLLIEIKDQDGAMGTDVGPLEAAAAAAIAHYKGPVAVMSFNPNSVAEMARIAPTVARGIVTGAYIPEEEPFSADICDVLREIPDYERTGSAFISHEDRDLSRPRVAELKAAGARILCWTIKSPEQEAKARRIAENITFEGYCAALPA